VTSKRWKKSTRIYADINITPLTDVMLVLLLIFIVTTPLIVQAGIKVQLPQAASAEVAPAEGKSVTISIGADGTMTLNEERIALPDLAARLPKAISESKSKVVVINADREVQHGQVVAALDAARQSGAEKLAISTAPKRRVP
jgi:biopolymer transport protein ExbD